MTTELGPYLGEVEEYREGEFQELPPEDDEFKDYWIGGGWGDPGWTSPQSTSSSTQGPQPTGSDRGADRARREKEKRVAQILKERKEFEEAYRKAQFEELKARRREYRRKYRREPGKVIGAAWKTAGRVLGPKAPTKGWYIPPAQRGLYVPGVPAWRPTTEFMPAGEAHRPQLGSLRRAGTPPSSTPIKVPMRDVERFEGLGASLSRLRKLEKFPEIDQAVYAEIHANGDIDTPSHVRREVSQLGFSKKEIDASLKRLRNLGLIVPTGQAYNGEKELMVAGGEDGR